MSKPSKEGAAAAATYFLELYDYMFATTETAAFAAMSGGDCEFCTSSLDDAKAMHKAKQRSVGSEVTLSNARGSETSPGKWYFAELDFDQSPARVVDEHGSTISAHDGGSYHFVVALTWADGWVVERVAAEPTPVSSASK